VMSPTATGPVGLATKNVTTFAGQAGAIGSADGTGTAAAFWFPAGGIFISTTLYVCDSANSTIRAISNTGVVTTIAGVAGFAGYFDNSGTGIATSYFNHPEGIATDGSSLYVADSGNNVIRKIATPGVNTSVVSTLAGNLNGFPGSSNGTGGAASFNNPLGITYNGTDLFVADSGNSTIRQVTTAGVVTPIAGQAGVFGSTDGTGTGALFTYPQGIVSVGATNLYVADTWNCTIRLVTTAGVVTTIAGQAGVKGDVDSTTGTSANFNWPEGIATDGTNLYVADTLNSAIRLVVIAFPNAVSTYAGQGEVAGSADGTGNVATFNHPMRVVVNGTSLYVADTYNETIRKIP